MRAAGKAVAAREARSVPPAPDAFLARQGKAISARLAKLGVTQGFDLVLHLPLRYDDETRLSRIADAPHGQTALVEGRVTDSSIKYRPKRQLVCSVEDESGVLVVRFLNFYPSQVKQFAPGTRVRFFGEVRQGFFGAEMVHPKYRVLRGDVPLSKTLTPVYPTTAGLGQAQLRSLVEAALEVNDLVDTVPVQILARLELPVFRDSIGLLHHPPPDAAQQPLQERTHPAWRRIKFDELLAQQLSMRIHREENRQVRAPRLTPRGHLAQSLIERLPFRLTGAQQRALAEIRGDLAQPHPMQRLLQGDVGSGKTIVAALAALQAIENGLQVAIMAPTEILGEQHFNKFSAWLAPLGIEVVWVAGAMPRKQKREVLTRVANGSAQIAIGTHALFQDEVEFSQLGLAIVDEQHRFGVRQRLALRLKGTGRGARQPHQLMMSATPIPRTLAMSYYADLDVSVIDELPPGRQPVVTRLIANGRREEVIQRVRDACMGGSQAYWVCPLIEESEALQLQTALDTYERLVATFPELKTGLVHGRLRADEKAGVMQSFEAGAVQLLVATTVIEVGVDVPNATLMVIENAERMGLSQLHQLRGRVGRGDATSACILLYQHPLSALARERLRIVYENSDGFEIARHDLRLRGPGEILGSRQSGVPLLRFADLARDVDLLDAARDAASAMLRDMPEAAERHLQRWLGGKRHYLRV
jgi:ATP-dependent DNA helicase RecG